MKDVLQKIEQVKLVPVVTIQKIEDTADMLEGLLEGGLPVAEICFRTDCAEEAIKLAFDENDIEIPYSQVDVHIIK